MHEHIGSLHKYDIYFLIINGIDEVLTAIYAIVSKLFFNILFFFTDFIPTMFISKFKP